MNTIIKDTFNILKNTASLGNNLKLKRLIIAHKQSPNLKRILTKAQFSSEKINYSTNKCNSACQTCRLYLKQSDHHIFKETGTRFNLRYNFTCTSKNLIYVLICSVCYGEYIGQTSTQLKQRLNTHIEQINHDNLRMLKVSNHIYNCSKGKFQIFPFYKLKSDNKYEREQKELYFIKKFKPALNH